MSSRDLILGRVRRALADVLDGQDLLVPAARLRVDVTHLAEHLADRALLLIRRDEDRQEAHRMRTGTYHNV